MNYLLLVIKLIPAIIALVKAIEAELPVSGQGKAKLDLATDIVASVYDESKDLQDGTTKDKLLGMVIKIIAKVVGIFNASGTFQKAG